MPAKLAGSISCGSFAALSPSAALGFRMDTPNDRAGDIGFSEHYDKRNKGVGSGSMVAWCERTSRQTTIAGSLSSGGRRSMEPPKPGRTHKSGSRVSTQVSAMPARTLTSLATRHRRPEIMDRINLDPQEHARALSGLARINWLSRSDAILWPPIERLARGSAGRSIRVLDLASGAGDVPLALAKRALRTGLAIEIEGCDVSSEAVRYAQQRALDHGVAVRFFGLDVCHGSIPSGYDVITCSLFLHHLDNGDACFFLRRAGEAAGSLLLVNDLVRDPIGYLLAWCGCRLLSRSPVVWHDGPVSVAGAFSLAEVRQLVADARLEGASVARRWPRRFLLSWGR